MKFCGLIPINNSPLAVTTVTTLLLFNTPSFVEARRRGGKNKNAASGTKGLFGNGDLRFFLNANNQGNKNQVKPSFGGFGGFNNLAIPSTSNSNNNEFNPTFSAECQPNSENVESASNSQKCGCPKSVTGMGRGYFPGYVFDQDKMECTQIISGSPFQGRSLNFFVSQDECIGACLVPERVVIKSGLDNNNNNDNVECRPRLNKNPTDQDRCNCKASVRGMQRGYFKGYVYNQESNQCEDLISGGYHGRTINWFTSKSDCQNACVIEDEQEVKEDLTLKFGFGFGGFGGGADIEPDYDCLGEPQFAGMCRAMMTRFSYNVENHKCEAQLYGGCGGYTTNSFPTMELCEKTCTASNKKEEPTQNKNNQISIPRGVEPADPVAAVSKPVDNLFDSGNDQGFFLDDFLSSYSQKYENDINLIFGCSDENPCACPKNVGRAGFGLKAKQWYYSSVSNKCIDFIYKGFGGNQNRFNSEAACNKKCIQGFDENNSNSKKVEPVAVKKSSSCDDKYLGDMVNSCRAMVFRWSYNSINNQCEKVIWGGCASFFGQILEDSANNFATQGECLRTCKPESNSNPGSSGLESEKFISRSFNLPSLAASNPLIPEKPLEKEARCSVQNYPAPDGNGIDNVYYVYNESGRCRPVSYSTPQVLSDDVNLFTRFINCRKACQPEVFSQLQAQKKGR